MLKVKLVIARKAVIYMAKSKIEPNAITASRIKFLRRMHKMTQYELGQLIGRQIQAVNAYEKLKKPSSYTGRVERRKGAITQPHRPVIK